MLYKDESQLVEIDGIYFLDKKIASVHLTFRLVEPWIVALSLLGVLGFLVYVLWPGREPDN